MKIKDQICSFEQAKKLLELGVKLNTLWSYWTPDGYENEKIVVYQADLYEHPYYPAPTVAEFGVLLGDFQVGFHWWDIKLYYVQLFLDGILMECRKETEAQARAEALIWLIENRYIKPEDLKL